MIIVFVRFYLFEKHNIFTDIMTKILHLVFLYHTLTLLILYHACSVGSVSTLHIFSWKIFSFMGDSRRANCQFTGKRMGTLYW